MNQQQIDIGLELFRQCLPNWNKENLKEKWMNECHLIIESKAYNGRYWLGYEDNQLWMNCNHFDWTSLLRIVNDCIEHHLECRIGYKHESERIWIYNPDEIKKETHEDAQTISK